ncbi:hypothetical protein BJ878DRAFT_562367 [Calycina marina]|uniref:Uncharacterized protein n=1 Tax=Calycina marina TaxID=1763456 RepID=A0A9P7YVW7_9HELO|nr:hypothetical protein BJ878DRAFT_562367 [Calycina marina]
MVETLKQKNEEGGDKEDVAKVRARRVSKPKVKTGCNNCKYVETEIGARTSQEGINANDVGRVRKVKCDETWPQCTRRRCDEYPAYRKRIDLAIVIAPRPLQGDVIGASWSLAMPPTHLPARTSSKPVMVQIIAPEATRKSQSRPPSTPISDEEAKSLDFWSRGVLQESHSEATIRHAVVVLGALYKTLDKVTESPTGSPDANSLNLLGSAPTHYNFALQQ